MIKKDILALHQLTESIVVDLASENLLKVSRRERKAIELIFDAHQALFAACINLDLIKSNDRVSRD